MGCGRVFEAWKREVGGWKPWPGRLATGNGEAESRPKNFPQVPPTLPTAPPWSPPPTPPPPANGQPWSSWPDWRSWSHLVHSGDLLQTGTQRVLWTIRHSCPLPGVHWDHGMLLHTLVFLLWSHTTLFTTNRLLTLVLMHVTLALGMFKHFVRLLSLMSACIEPSSTFSFMSTFTFSKEGRVKLTHLSSILGSQTCLVRVSFLVCISVLYLGIVLSTIWQSCFLIGRPGIVMFTITGTLVGTC